MHSMFLLSSSPLHFYLPFSSLTSHCPSFPLNPPLLNTSLSPFDLALSYLRSRTSNVPLLRLDVTPSLRPEVTPLLRLDKCVNKLGIQICKTFENKSIVVNCIFLGLDKKNSKLCHREQNFYPLLCCIMQSSV